MCLNRKWFHNRFWPLWWPVWLPIRVQTTLNHIRFVFFITISKITKEIFVNICSQLKSTETDLKVQALHYANELLVRVRLSFQKLFQTRSTCRSNNKKIVWKKSNDAFSLAIRVQTMINHISICFLPQYQRQRKWFSSERELKKALRDTLTRADRNKQGGI